MLDRTISCPLEDSGFMVKCSLRYCVFGGLGWLVRLLLASQFGPEKPGGTLLVVTCGSLVASCVVREGR